MRKTHLRVEYLTGGGGGGGWRFLGEIIEITNSKLKSANSLVQERLLGRRTESASNESSRISKRLRKTSHNISRQVKRIRSPINEMKYVLLTLQNKTLPVVQQQHNLESQTNSSLRHASQTYTEVVLSVVWKVLLRRLSTV